MLPYGLRLNAEFVRNNFYDVEGMRLDLPQGEAPDFLATFVPQDRILL
jgi:hypothetical protein